MHYKLLYCIFGNLPKCLLAHLYIYLIVYLYIHYFLCGIHILLYPIMYILYINLILNLFCTRGIVSISCLLVFVSFASKYDVLHNCISIILIVSAKRTILFILLYNILTLDTYIFTVSLFRRRFIFFIFVPLIAQCIPDLSIELSYFISELKYLTPEIIAMLQLW